VSSDTAVTSIAGPRISSGPGRVKEGFGLCMISLNLESAFDTEESDCGGDAGNTVEAATGSGGCRSVVMGSDGVWKATGPVP